MKIVAFIALAAVGLSLLTGLAVYLYGRFAYRLRGRETHALQLGSDTEIDACLGPVAERHPGLSGLQLSAESLDAFAIRASSARAAGRSLDLMYYYWKEDLTGTLLAGEVLAAADRGVRVRMLLDDINLRGRDTNYLSLSAHENIEVRVFNPSWNRVGALQRGFELIIRAFSSTRRMHNKAWLADGRFAVVGGRNIGDAYFDAASKFNFRDLDLCAIGPVVQQTEAVFDEFWNSACAHPLSSLRFLVTGNLDALRKAIVAVTNSAQAKPFLDRLGEATFSNKMLDTGSKFHWCGTASVIFDPPGKSDGNEKERWLYKPLFALALSARSRLDMMSPYFIPGPLGVTNLTKLVADGVSVTVLTNSLAATDVAAVHGGYSKYRKALLEGGVGLYELRPKARRRSISLFGSRNASLHTKAFTVDGRAGFVGSFNFDPRSISLNTEMGIVFESEGLAKEIEAQFTALLAPEASWKVLIDEDGLGWRDGAGTEAKILRHEPVASLRRRFVARLVSWLPVESQL